MLGLQGLFGSSRLVSSGTAIVGKNQRVRERRESESVMRVGVYILVSGSSVEGWKV